MKKLKVKTTSGAEDDLQEVVQWLSEESLTQAGQFLDSFEDTRNHIALTPEGFAKYYKDFRKAGMQKFPYSVYYEPDTEKEEATVAAVVHQARSRRTILGKLKRKK